MSKTVLLGRDQKIIEIPETAWKQDLEQVPQHIQPRLSFMTDVQHQIRYFVVKQMAKIQKPIPPEFISDELKIGLEHVKSILEELERNLFFLVKNEHGEVVWAYPITVETTPHKIKFKSGERLFGA